MTDASSSDGQNPYAPPPAGASAPPPEPTAPTPPSAYQPPAPAAYQPPPPAVPQADAPAYPVAPYQQTPQPAPATGKKQSSPQTTGIIAVVAGALSIFILPFVLGVVGIGMGVTTLRLNGIAKREGRPVSVGHTIMGIAGIALGAIGLIAKFAMDALL